MTFCANQFTLLTNTLIFSVDFEVSCFSSYVCGIGLDCLLFDEYIKMISETVFLILFTFFKRLSLASFCVSYIYV